ncbi:hypothetical protein [Cystobacter fuscus]|uniref:hypothetical protein n=1 Tax=Cystobacter fuscus TaxID=43 RepID=UPI0037C12E72
MRFARRGGSNFELPYLPCLIDKVAWTPGSKNKGWAIGSNDDPAALVAKNGADRPFLYYVVADIRSRRSAPFARSGEMNESSTRVDSTHRLELRDLRNGGEGFL